MNKGSSPSRRVLATGAAVLAHLLVLAALGWRIPLTGKPPSGPEFPPLHLTIVRPKRPAPPAVGGAAAPTTRFARQAPEAAQAPSPLPPSGSPAPAAVAQGPPDCEPEDLPLLTEAEKARCRNQIDADKARQAARAADDAAARQAARAQGAPRLYRMDPDKEAAYAIAALANEQKRLPPIMGHSTDTGTGNHIGIGVTCSHVNIPILSGVETNPNLFAKKHKQERPAHGSASCSAGLR